MWGPGGGGVGGGTGAGGERAKKAGIFRKIGAKD
jgi:hypothetical protein